MAFTEQEIAKIRLVLKRISFLEFLKFSEMDSMIHAMEKKPFRKGEVIVKQGSRGDCFYIMGAGVVGVYKEKFLTRKRIATLGPEAFFGEMALLGDAPRNATIMADEDGEYYTISRAAFQQTLMKNPMISQVIRQTAAYRNAQNKSAEG